jgi:hypothetical protein
MEFYKGNKLLNELNLNSNFKSPPNGVWCLLYADSSNHSVLNLRVYESEKVFTKYRDFFPLFKSLPASELIISGQDSFKLKWSNSSNFELFNSDSLYQEYLEKNLVLGDSYKGKPFNSKASSFYHIWQSKQRFIGGVTDIDLLRLDDKNNPIELFEIKRSKILLDSWNPYFNDKGGYEILASFCKAENIDFTIIYYHYSTEELIEDVTKLMVIKKLEGFNFKKLGVYNFKEFISRTYIS